MDVYYLIYIPTGSVLRLTTKGALPEFYNNGEWEITTHEVWLQFISKEFGVQND